MRSRASIRRLDDFAAAMLRYRRMMGTSSTREELLNLQRRRLVDTVRHAAASSPLYRELYAGVELSDDLDVRSLPVVTKAMLMERFDEWVTDPRVRLADVEAHLERVRGDDLYLGEYRCMSTGGTSGHKGIFIYGRDEWRECLVASLRWGELRGVRPRIGRRVRIALVMATSPLHMTARFGLSMDVGVYAMCRLDARQPLGELVAALNAHQPEHLAGYTSMVSLLAIEQFEGRLRITPRTVVTTGEVRTEEMAANIRDAWGVAPFEAYGTTEGLFGGDCESHRGMHVFEDLGLVEVVDERGDRVPEGVVGNKLLVTSFIKRTQPLLRYEITDMVGLTTAPCECGRPLARMTSLEGRSDDILRFAGTDGGTVPVHPLTLRSPMAAFPELRQYKIVQDHDGLHVIAALRDGVAEDGAAQRIRATLSGSLFAAGVAVPRLEITIVPEVPRDHGVHGKFKVIEAKVAVPAKGTVGVDL